MICQLINFNISVKFANNFILLVQDVLNYVRKSVFHLLLGFIRAIILILDHFEKNDLIWIYFGS